MNKVLLTGRLTKDPEITSTTASKKIARYTLAVDRRGEGADFVPCVTFDRGADFAEKYLSKGMKIAIEGKIQTGSYTNRDGQKVYTTDVIVSDHEFLEPKKQTNDGFIDVAEEGLPFRG